MLHPDTPKAQFHPLRIAQWMESKDDWGKAKKLYPLYVEISPSGACNHRCTFCAVDYLGYKANLLNHEALVLALAGMAQNGVQSIMWAGEGEPLLYKKLNDAIACADAYGLSQAVTTNGVLLDKLKNIHRLKFLKISCNAGTPETYREIHKGKPEDWDIVWANISEASKRKGDCQLTVQMVVLPENEAQVRNLYDMAAKSGADLVILKPYSQHERSITTRYKEHRSETFEMMKSHPDWSPQLIVRSDSPSHNEQEYKQCFSTPNLWAYISSTGDVYTCSAYLLDERFKIGNIHERSFREIWEGEKRRQNWELLKTLDITGCRKNCRMHQTNNYLWNLHQGVPYQEFL